MRVSALTLVFAICNFGSLQAHATDFKICKIVLNHDRYTDPALWSEIYYPLKSTFESIYGIPVVESAEGISRDGGYKANPLRVQLNPNISFVKKTVILSHASVHVETDQMNSSNSLRGMKFESPVDLDPRLAPGHRRGFQADEAIAYRISANLIETIEGLGINEGLESSKSYFVISDRIKDVTEALLGEAIVYLKRHPTLNYETVASRLHNMIYIKIYLERLKGIPFYIYYPLPFTRSVIKYKPRIFITSDYIRERLEVALQKVGSL